MLIIHQLIKEYYEMQDGEHINDFQKSIEISNGGTRFILKRKVLKHIVEQRKWDGYSLEGIMRLFSDIHEVILADRYLIIPNKRESSGFLFIEATQAKIKGVVLVLEVAFQGNGSYVIKTGFYRTSAKIRKLFR